MSIVSILTAILTGLLTIIGYFIKKHIESVEVEVKRLRVELTAVKQDTIWLTNTSNELKSMHTHNTREVQVMLGKLGVKLDSIKDNESHIMDRLNAQEKHLENYGQVIRVLSGKK